MTACINTLSAQRSITQDEQDQQKLLDSVVVSSQAIPVESEGEKCIEIVQDLLKNELRVSLNKTDIIAPYRPFNSLQSENQANCSNLQQQQQEITLLQDDNRNLRASRDQLQHDLNGLREENIRLKSDEAIKKQEEALSKMTACINTLSAQRSVTQDEQDQQKLLDSVVVSSQAIPVESEGEKCIEIVQDLLKSELQVTLNKTDIIAPYRVGKTNPTGQNQRKIRLKLASQSTKSHLVQTAASQRKGIYINECLTRKRQHLLYHLRQIRQQNPDAIHQCFVRDGVIKVRKTSTGKHFDDVSALIETIDNKFTFIIPTETWLKEDTTQLFNMPNYSAIHNCRQIQRGGGTALYYHHELTCHHELKPFNSLQSENQANCSNLQQQQQEITLLQEDNRNLRASRDQLQHDLNGLREENIRLKSDEAIKKQEEALSKMTACINTLSAHVPSPRMNKISKSSLTL
ncbi:GRIP and coiled-coil domain-containing protein 2-like [Procambarus clarkii]|uniref:GRIP and coiled-coil domain-containing protein 2-like n=1 Tax=Procambarus clarkii TaxID=6728 RepID=UPI0037422C6A